MDESREAEMVGARWWVRWSGGLVRCGGVVVVGGVDNKVGRSALAPVRLALHAQHVHVHVHVHARISMYVHVHVLSRSGDALWLLAPRTHSNSISSGVSGRTRSLKSVLYGM